MPGPAAPETKIAQASPARALWHLITPTLAVLSLALLLLGAAALTLGWLLRSEAGTAWLLPRLPGVEARGIQGALWSPRLQVQQLQLTIGSSKSRLIIDALDAQGMVWRWRPDGQAWVGLQLAMLSAQRVTLHSGEGSAATAAPESLRLPLALDIALLQLEQLQLDALPPLRALRARVALATQAGSEHRIDDLSFDWEQARARGGARIAADAPFALSVRARLEPAAAADRGTWDAELEAQGALARVQLEGTLRGSARPGHIAPSLDLSATLVPLAPWPVAALSARTQALDLAALSAAAPQTRLSGTVDIQTEALRAPINAEVRLENLLPGRWDERRVPMRSLQLSLSALASQRDSVELRGFDVRFGQGNQDGGRWRGSGHWRGSTLQLDSRVEDLRPQLLDGRAARLQATGPLTLSIRGLPSPDPAAAASDAPIIAELRGHLEGRADASPQPVRLELDASLGAQRIELRGLRASAGAAQAQLQGQAQRAASGQWSIKTQGSLADFDPLLWWPGAEGSAWRQGPHRLSAQWALDLSLPSGAQRLQAPQLLQTTLGNGSVRVHDSVLAGVPLQLDLTLSHGPGGQAAQGQPSRLRGELRLAGNRMLIEAVGNPAGDGSADRWQAELRGESLAQLAPVARLVPEWAEWAPRAGAAQATITGQGRWPAMRTEGRVGLEQAQLGELVVARGQVSWRIDTASDQPLNVQVNVDGARLARQALEQLRAELQGTWARHTLQMHATLPLKPPVWAETSLGLRTRNGTRLRLTGDGAWSGDGAGGGTWRGRVAELSAGPWDHNGAASSPAAPAWLDARELRGELRFAPRGGLVELRAEAGRLRLADAVTLRWDEVRIDTRGERPDFSLRAQIDPFAAAPVLARLQPAMGWSGDLQLGGSVELNASARFDADIVFERRSGDLVVEDAYGRQPLGLTDLRLALNAHDGRWYATQALAGRSLGEMSGALSLQTGADKRWPDAQTPIDGVIEARVAHLGIWGAWVPPGWRLNGSLTTSASVSGRVGAPEYRGQIRGQSIGVRNLLQGVEYSGGDVNVTLSGATAQIEQFTLRGGEGSLSIGGSAELGTVPSARLQLQAQRFRVLGRIDRLLIASGKATLELRSEGIKLDGDLRVDEGLFDVSRSDTPALDSDVVVRSATGGTPEPASAETPATPRRLTQVLVKVDLGDKLHVRGRGLDTALTGQLRITTPGGRLAIDGIVRTEGGTYAAYGQKLEIERGILSFSGPPDNPALDILALRPNIDARVGVAIAGSFVTPRVRLYSSPEMGDTDKLSWLVLGRPSDGLGRADTALLQRAAVALLAGEGEAPTDALLRAIGLDELSLRQSDGEVRETVITLGKQLSRRWYLGYERGVNATAGTWQLIYRIAQRFTVRAQSGNENSLDVIWVWRVGETPLLPVPKSAGSTPP